MKSVNSNFQNKSIFLLDDVLSAVDGPVARHIMRHCVHGFLAGKTVLLATNKLALLTKTDWIIHLKNGTIESQGKTECNASSFKNSNLFFLLLSGFSQ